MSKTQPNDHQRRIDTKRYHRKERILRINLNRNSVQPTHSNPKLHRHATRVITHRYVNAVRNSKPRLYMDSIWISKVTSPNLWHRRSGEATQRGLPVTPRRVVKGDPTVSGRRTINHSFLDYNEGAVHPVLKLDVNITGHHPSIAIQGTSDLPRSINHL